ncbi:MAG: histidine kinase [Methylobacterium sp.]|nr:histidine kinase [Methylobacterium sp.]MBX9931388.1 histidine kinase [Methylobacterium sp.]
MSKHARDISTLGSSSSPGGAYGVQVLIAGRQKHWRDEVACQIRRAGYVATTVDCGIDAMTVLALGLPVDVLVTDVTLQGELCSAKLAVEARALRPDLRIVFARDLTDRAWRETEGLAPRSLFVAPDPRADAVASTVREALTTRA